MTDQEQQTEELRRLLLAVGNRDSKAFAALYGHARAKLFGLALRILKRQDRAEEVLQESFVAIWNHAGDYSAEKSAPMTWMTTIVRNRCLDQVRRPGYESAELDDALLDTLQDEGDGPLELLRQSQDARRLADCMGKLEAPQRQSLMLAFFQGLTHSELALHLREPLGTVKTRIRRALASLKNCLQ
jgi:RNA polymerase sigma-70 factor (ECF subfamily)